MIKKRKAFRIYGKVVSKVTGQGISNLKVKAFDKDLFFDDVLGEVTTDKEGNFEIVYDKDDFKELFFDNQPDIYINVKTTEGEEVYSTEDKIRYRAGDTEEFIVRVPDHLISYPEMRYKVSVLRPKDMLRLDFRFINIKKEIDKLTVLDKNAAAFMIVEFPPQHIAEEAFFEADKDKYPVTRDEDPDKGNTTDDNPYYPCKSRISENSRLVFKVPKNAEIDYSVEGLLKACSEFDLSVAPTATPLLIFLMAEIKPNDLLQRVEILSKVDPAILSMQKTNAFKPAKDLKEHQDASSAAAIDPGQWAARTTMKKYLPQAYDNAIRMEVAELYWERVLQLFKPKLKKPTGLETSIEAPFRLIISPNRYAAWAHSLKAASSPSTNRYELWHTRYALRLDNKINEEEERLRTVRAIWARDFGFKAEYPYNPPSHYPPISDDNPFRMSLDAFDRHNIVHLSANNHISHFLPLPVSVKRLMLTSLGAWMNLRGAWNPPGGLSVEEWRHRGTMGRDHYVRVVYKGYLFPFGHRASLIKVTERKFHPEITHYLEATTQVFTKKMDGNLQTSTFRFKPEVNSIIRAINQNFENEIYSLIGSIEGKSYSDINQLVKASQKKFNEQTGELVKSAGDKLGEELISMAENAKEEFKQQIDLAIKDIRTRFTPETAPGNIAYLRQRMYIVVRKPERIMVNNTGLKEENGYSFDRQFPFWNVQTTTLVTPDLDKPEDSEIPENSGHGQSLFWPKVGGQYFQFHLIARDFAENEVEFTAPLIFIEQNMLNFEDAAGNPDSSLYDEVKLRLQKALTEYETLVKPDISGQSIMFADSTHDPGKTTLETSSIVFSALIPETMADVSTMKWNLGDQDIPPFYPAIHKANVIIPSIKHLAGNNETVEIHYDDIYLKHGFDGNQNKGEVFVDIDQGLKLDFNSQGDRSGGLVKPNMDIKGLSRLLGPVSGSTLTGIAGGTFDPKDFFGALDAKIFGVIDLWDIIQLVLPDDFLTKLKKVMKLTTDRTSDEMKVELKWEPELKDWNKLFIAKNDANKASLTILGQMTVKSSGDAEVNISCTMKNFSIDLLGNLESFIIIRFDDITFKYSSGTKADVDVNINKIEFVGVLSFVETLRRYIPLDGFSDPPSIDVTEKGITAGYSLALPNFAVGVFSLENISLGASFTIPFINDPLTVRFNFCERHSPFLLTVYCIGGGGFFAITLDPKGVQLLEAAFEFGAKISVSFGVASGGVYVMAGIYFRMEMNPDKASLTGYFRLGGEVDVLGIISVSIELYLSLTYEFHSGKCAGKATLTIEVEIIFFSICVEISVEKKFAGSNGDPTFKEMMGQYLDPESGEKVNPWKEYCEAFA